MFVVSWQYSNIQLPPLSSVGKSCPHDFRVHLVAFGHLIQRFLVIIGLTKWFILTSSSLVAHGLRWTFVREMEFYSSLVNLRNEVQMTLFSLPLIHLLATRSSQYPQQFSLLMVCEAKQHYSSLANLRKQVLIMVSSPLVIHVYR